MKTNILGLRTCGYYVSDLAEATRWYAAMFNTQPYFNEPFYVGFNIGGFELGLLPEEKQYPSKSDNILTYWGVEDINAVYNKFIEGGAKPHEEPHSVGEPLMVASVKDPWDNVIGFIYNPVFKIPD